MRKRYLYLYPLLIVASVIGLLYVATPKAHAALAGENGPILYIEEVPLPSPTPSEQTDTSYNVVTTNQSGTGDITAAESPEVVTAAAISAPGENNSYDIAFGQKSDNSEDCTVNERTCAVIQSLTIDSNRENITPASELTTLDPLVGNGPRNNSDSWVSQLSFSPDGKTVLATEFSTNESENMRSALIAIDAKTGDTDTIVAARRDPCLNAGYAMNGTVYYSRINHPLNDVSGCEFLQYIDDEDLNYQSDIWFIRSGEILPTRLTYTSNISEYFIDVAPDNSVVLVADANTCEYSGSIIFKDFLPKGCEYYYINTLDGINAPLFGNIDAKMNFAENFVPTFFSPDGNYIIGSIFEGRDDPTAIVSRSNLSSYEVINTLVGVQQWAPAVAVVPVTATPAATSTAPTLPNTGANSNAIFALALILIALGASTLVRNRKNI